MAKNIERENLDSIASFYVMRHMPYTAPTKNLIAEFLRQGPAILPIRIVGVENNTTTLPHTLKGITHIFTAPSVRTQATARLVASMSGCYKITICEELAPRYIGPWDYYREIAEKLCENLPLDTPDYFKIVLRNVEQHYYIGAESKTDYAIRIERAIQQILNENENAKLLWVAHASGMRHLYQLCGRETTAPSRPHYGSISEFHHRKIYKKNMSSISLQPAISSHNSLYEMTFSLSVK